MRKSLSRVRACTAYNVTALYAVHQKEIHFGTGAVNSVVRESFAAAFGACRLGLCHCKALLLLVIPVVSSHPMICDTGHGVKGPSSPIPSFPRTRATRFFVIPNRHI